MSSQSPAADLPAGGAAPTGGPGEYIGALISLVSRSEVRYQGFLAQIDPEAATIALEQVRSFGTEGRLAAQGRPAEEIGIQNNSYDFVTFRAADVKDLKIDDPRPNREQQSQQQPAFVDPAILGSSGPNTYGAPPPPQAFGPGSPWGPGGPPPHAHPYHGAYGHPGPSPYGMHPPPPGAFGGPAPPTPQQQQQQQTPAPATAPAPKSPSKPIPTGPKAATQQQQQPPTGPSRPAQANTNGAAAKPGPPPNAPKGPSNKSPATNKKPAAAAAAAVTPAPPTAPSADKIADDLNNLKVKDEEKSTAAASSSTVSAAPAPATLSPPIKANLPARPQVPTPRGVPGGGGRPRAPPTSVFDNRNGAGPEVPSGDFDFESANARFAKEAAEGSQAGASAANAATSPSAAGAAAAEAVLLDAIPPPEESPKSFYDKSSFFDNISSEVRDRYDRTASATSPQGERVMNARGGGVPARGGGRQARFEEDRKNLDTFGEVGNAYRGGRGGRGRGQRGGFRGGPRGRGGRGRGRGGVGGFGAGISLA